MNNEYIPTRQKKRPRPRGTILVSQLPGSPKARAVRADILDRLAQHAREGTLPRGPRGLFYDLRPRGIPANPRGVSYLKHPQEGAQGMEASPGYVADQLALMRRVWIPETGEMMIDEDWIADAHAPEPEGPSEVADAAEAAETIAIYLRHLKLARQAAQPFYLELRSEAGDLVPRLARVAGGYGVTVYSGGGMDGLKPKKEAARRAARREVPTIIGHIADFDIYGGNIADAFAEDAIAWTEWHRREDGARGSLSVVRLALTHEQAAAHELLDEQGKAEVDGLPVPVLDQLVRDFIESHLDPQIARRIIESEPAMRAEAARRVSRHLRGAARIPNPSDLAPGDWSWARGI
jgi:hypothetical protein